MPGSLNTDSVIWAVGEASGVSGLGASSELPRDAIKVQYEAGAPSGAPTDSPFHLNSSNHKLYAWIGTQWVPVSGFNT